MSFRLETEEDERSGTRLVLRDLTEPKIQPLFVDFVSGGNLHRLKHGLGKGQPLPKALGLKSLNPARAPFVLDVTAGLGTDAFFMAAMGCRVHAIERCKEVFALLDDGSRRLRLFAESEEAEDAGVGEALRSIVSRLSFENADAASALVSLEASNERPDVVYLDPMYPEEGRSKSALPKKGMQIFRRLIGDDLDASEIFSLALRVARERVVVKRPLSAPALGGKPTHVFEGKTARFDMHLVRHGA